MSKMKELVSEPGIFGSHLSTSSNINTLFPCPGLSSFPDLPSSQTMNVSYILSPCPLHHEILWPPNLFPSSY